MNVRHEATDATQSSRHVPAVGDIAATTLSRIEAAADFERCLDAASPRCSTPPDNRSEATPSTDSRAIDEDTRVAEAIDAEEAGGDDVRSVVPPWAAHALVPCSASDAPQSAATAPSSPAWAEVCASIERLLVMQSAGPHAGAAAMFRLAPEVLRETSVALSRVEGGWRLRIDSGDPRLRLDAERHERALRERFECSGLGELTIEQGELPALGG
jgi:hypothetical protein